MRLSRIRFISNFPGKPEMLRYTLFLLAMLPATGAGVAAQEPAYMLVIKDHQFQPTEIEVPAGQKIALLVKNNDSTPEEFESTELRREKVVAGGEQITVYIGPLKPGTYEFFGDFNPKTARGHIIAK
jgi:heme/copper-type cytochrome/quinol oxidase subunit 2